MNKAPSVLLLEHHLKALKLPTFLRDYASVGAVCSQKRADYPTCICSGWPNGSWCAGNTSGKPENRSWGEFRS